MDMCKVPENAVKHHFAMSAIGGYRRAIHCAPMKN
jgi:hypothetical protein